jgi:hypothetical protein
MRNTLLTVVLFSSPLFAVGSVSPVAFTESKGSVRGFSAGGDVTLSTDQFRVDVQYPDGKTERSDVFVVYDPATGRYLWELSPVQPGGEPWLTSAFQSGKWVVYAGGDEMVDFYMPGQLSVQEWTRRETSLDAASAAAVRDIEQRVRALKSGRLEGTFVEVPLGQAMGKAFACAGFGEPDFSPTCSFHAEKISSVTREGDNWRLVIENRWAQEVILDSKFALVSTRRIETPAQ